MLKFETSRGKLENIEVSGDATELLADVCVVITGIADKLIESKRKQNTVGYMIGLDHVLSDEGWKLIFEEVPRPSKFIKKQNKDESDESEQ